MKIWMSKTGVYKARIRTLSGRMNNISLQTESLEEAKQFAKESGLQELEDEARRGSLTNEGVQRIISGSPLTTNSAIEAYGKIMADRECHPLTIRDTLRRLRRWAWAMDLGTKPPSAITPKMVDDWVNCEDPRKRSTRELILTNLRAFFQAATYSGWCLTNPAQLSCVRHRLLSHAQKEVRPRAIYTDEEIERLLKVTEPGSFAHSAIAISRYTGLRMGDIACLEWATLDEPGFISVWTSKKDKRVRLPLRPARLVFAIETIPRDPMSRYLFPNQAEAYIEGRHAAVGAKFRPAFRKAGIKGKNFHDLRSTFCHNALKEGLSLDQVAALVGHNQVEQTLGYVETTAMEREIAYQEKILQLEAEIAALKVGKV